MQSDYFNTILVSPETVIEEGEKVKKEVNAKTNKHVRQPPTLIKNTKKIAFFTFHFEKPIKNHRLSNKIQFLCKVDIFAVLQYKLTYFILCKLFRNKSCACTLINKMMGIHCFFRMIIIFWTVIVQYCFYNAYN